MAKFTVKITSAKTDRVIGTANVIADNEGDAQLRAVRKIIGRSCGFMSTGSSMGNVTRSIRGGGTSVDEQVWVEADEC